MNLCELFLLLQRGLFGVLLFCFRLGEACRAVQLLFERRARHVEDLERRFEVVFPVAARRLSFAICTFLLTLLPVLLAVIILVIVLAVTTKVEVRL